MTLLSLVYGLQPSEEQNLELTLCQILKHTSFFVIYKLSDKSNCYSHAKTFGEVVCLRDGENKVTKNFFIRFKLTEHYNYCQNSKCLISKLKPANENGFQTLSVLHLKQINQHKKIITNINVKNNTTIIN